MAKLTKLEEILVKNLGIELEEDDNASEKIIETIEKLKGLENEVTEQEVTELTEQEVTELTMLDALSLLVEIIDEEIEKIDKNTNTPATKRLRRVLISLQGIKDALNLHNEDK